MLPSFASFSKGNCCKILTRKGKSTVSSNPASHSLLPNKGGRTLFLPLFPHLDLQLFVPLYKFNRCMHERREPTWEFPSSFLPLWRFSETELRTMWNIYLWPKPLLSAVSSITDMLQGISPDNISVAELCYKSLFFPHPLCSPAVEPALHSSGLLGKRSCSSTSPGSRCRAHL